MFERDKQKWMLAGSLFLKNTQSHNGKQKATVIRWSSLRVQLLLTGALLFLMPHPLLKLLSNVQQWVLFAGEYPDCIAEAASLGFPVEAENRLTLGNLALCP